jgi:hypothetical protein
MAERYDDDEDEFITVKNADHMFTDRFIQHMELRHADSLGGLRYLNFPTDYVEECWRTFHDTLHRLHLTHLSHDHGQ